MKRDEHGCIRMETEDERDARYNEGDHLADERASNRVVGELTYISYAHNRDSAPDVSPERWAAIFPNGAALEARYQQERQR